MDVIVSPNKPRILHPGNFDGFPTGSCTEALPCGAMIVASDSLEQNPGYRDGEGIVVVQPTADAVDVDVDVDVAIREFLTHPPRVGQIARLGQRMSRRLYPPEAQIGERLQVIQDVARAESLNESLKPLAR